MSTKPGVTIAPAASIVRLPEPDTLPTSVIRPPSMAMSAVNGSAPVPSTTVPPVMTMSCDMDWSFLRHELPDCGEHLVLEQVSGATGLVAVDVGGRADDDQAV